MHANYSRIVLLEIKETTITLSNDTISDPLRPLFPQNRGPKCTSGPTSRRVLPSGEYDRRYWQGTFVLCRISLWAERCRLLPNYFGRCFLGDYVDVFCRCWQYVYYRLWCRFV